MIKSIRVLALLGMLALLPVAACLSESADPDSDPIESTHALDHSAADPACTSDVVDATDPAVAQALAGAEWQPVGAATDEVIDGKRVSRAQFLVKSKHGAQSRILPVTTECTSTCGGNGTCSGTGCSANSGGDCSTFSCVGSTCSGTCTKKSTYTPPPAN